MTAKNTTPAENSSLSAVIAAYLESIDTGEHPNRDALLAKHPELAGELQAFFAGQDGLEQAARPLRDAAVPADPLPGDVVRYFGDYELQGEIARGGMGIVYRARQVSLNRPVALKMILAGQLADEREVRRFRDEAESAANLDHPNIVPIYEVGEHEGRHYFSMKLIEGSNLGAHVERLRADFKEIARLMAAVARAVHHAHQRGILHRDLKPGNVLIDGEGQPFVTDFGLAKRIEKAEGLTASGAIVGTPEYMAPEQARGQKGLTTAADVYSLGAILYVLLTGKAPFAGDNVLEVLRQVAEAEPVPPRRIQARVPADLETVCLKCLAKEPGRRYASAEALAEELERWLRGEPITARPAGRMERAWRWCRRNPLVASLMAAVGLLLVAGATVATGFALRAEQKAADERAALQDLQKVAKAKDKALQDLEKEGKDKEKAQQDLQKEVKEVEKARQAAKQETTDAEKARQATQAELERARAHLMTAQLARVDAIYERDPGRALELLHDYALCPTDRRDVAWCFYERACSR